MAELVTDPVRLRAHAKLTVSLRVLGLRDDGFHELEALSVSLDAPADLVEVALRGDGRFTIQVAGESDGVPGGAGNLAVEAVRTLARRVEPGAGARVRLKKAIPAGAGLGGGSADAAAGLVAVTHLLPAETEGVDLWGLAAGLGSDVPFCLRGGVAWMRGRGEVLEPVGGEAPAVGVVVAVPPSRLSTPAVYERWDAMGEPAADRRLPVPSALAGLLDVRVNDLEPAALDLAPELAEFRDALEEATDAPALLAGSGSSYAVLFESVEEAEAVVEGVRDALPDAAVWATGLSAVGVTAAPA